MLYVYYKACTTPRLRDGETSRAATCGKNIIIVIIMIIVIMIVVVIISITAIILIYIYIYI